MNTEQLINSFSNFALFNLDQDGQIIGSNDAAKKILKLSSDDLSPKNFFTGLVTTKKTSGEQWFGQNSQTKFYAYYELAKSPDSVGYLLLIKELTEKQSQLDSQVKLNADLEKRTEVILKNAPVTLWAIDNKGIFQFYEGRGLKNLPDRESKQVGKSIFVAAAGYPRFEQTVHEALAGKAGEITTEVHESYFSTRITPQFDDNGKVIGAIGVTVDVTSEVKRDAERRKWDQEIRVEQEKLKKLISANIIGIAFWDSTGAVDANDAYLNMLGYTREEMKNGAINQKNIIPPEWRETNKKRVEEFHAKGSISPYELEHRRKDGTHVPVLIATVKLTEDSGVSWILDLTQQKKIEAEARRLEISEKSALEASKLKSTFLANMSHEIRTPINGVVGMTHLLKATPLSEEQKDLCDNIARSAESLLSVINDILDFSKVEAGKLEVESMAFDINDMVSETIRTMTFAAQKKSIALHLEYENPLNKLVVSDPGRIRQILNNLLSNAIKFTNIGFVTLRVKVADHGDKAHICFEVQDTGIGISNDNLNKLFTPFSQADSSTTRRYGGSGLGLSISKGLVELLNGKIGVNSELGKGSTFWVTLEAAIAKNAPIKKNREQRFSETTQFKNIYVLVAEDNQINQMVAVKMLEKMGYKPQAVANGHEVLKAISERDFDLILMDCQMPEMDGYEATRVIRGLSEDKYKNVPVIAMTANAVSGDKEKCLAAGMNDYISKPVEPDLLFSVIEKWLAHNHKQFQLK